MRTKDKGRHASPRLFIPQGHIQLPPHQHHSPLPCGNCSGVFMSCLTLLRGGKDDDESQMGVHCDCRLGRRGWIHLHIQESCFVFPLLIPVFPCFPCPAMSLQCWTGSSSCLPPVVNHHLSSTRDADFSAWLFREEAVLGDSSSPPGEKWKPFWGNDE